MNLQVKKLCSMCVKGHGVFKRHSYTVHDPEGKPIQLESCGFIVCDFCSVQTPDAPTVHRIALATRGTMLDKANAVIAGISVDTRHWGDAEPIVRRIAALLGAQIEYGIGNANPTGNVLIAATRDYESGDGRGYRLYHYPEGVGYNKRRGADLGLINVGFVARESA